MATEFDVTGMYGLQVQGEEIVFNEGGKPLFTVEAGKLARFSYLIEVVFKQQVRAGFGRELGSHDTLFLTRDAKSQITPKGRMLAKDLGSTLRGHRTASGELAEGWRLSAYNTPFKALAAVCEDFALIPRYNYTIPLTVRLTDPALRADYGDLLIRFKQAARGEGQAPANAYSEQFERASLCEHEALVSKEAVELIEDRGAYRVIRFKPEYTHTGVTGNEIAIDVKTPLSANELREALGAEIPVVVVPQAGTSKFGPGLQ